MHLYSSDNTILATKVDGCYYDLKVNPAMLSTGGEGGGLTSVLTTGTSTITFNGNGVSIPLQAHVKVSSTAGNPLSVVGDGLFVTLPSAYTDTQARAAITASSPLIYNNLTGNLSVNTASSIISGVISTTDWNTFNNKVGGADNIGSGAGIYKNKVGENLQLRKLSQGTGITVVESGDSILISSSVTSYTDANARAAITASAPLSYNNTTGVLTLPAASPTASGYLTSIDWNTFNNKVPQTRTVNTTLPLTGGGNLSTNLTLGMQKASLAQDGYLSKEDFTTFNQKQSTIVWDNLTAASTKVAVTGGTGATKTAVTVDVVPANIPLDDLSGTLSIAKGGTGQPTASAAINALMPSQTGQSGKVLGTDGTSVQWVTGGGGGGGENPLTFTLPLSRVGDTVSLPVANSVTNGYLSSSNWNTFSSKVDNGTNLGTSGATVFNAKNGTSLEFKRILPGTNVTVNDTGAAVIINAVLSSSVTSNPFNAISILEFGAVKNDSSTSAKNANVTAWNNMIAAAASGQMVVVPDGTFYFNNTLTATSITDINSYVQTKIFNIKIIGDCVFDPGFGFVLEGISHRWDSSGSTIRSTQTGTVWSSYTGTGLYLKNCDKCRVDIKRIEHFKTGLLVAGDSTGVVRGAQYNYINVDQIRRCQTQIWLSTFNVPTGGAGGGTNGNWCNSNIFHIRQLGAGTIANDGGEYGIRIQKDASSNQGDPFNSNYFYHVGLEGLINGLYWEFAHFNNIIGMRIEGAAVTNEIFLRSDDSTGLGCLRNKFSDCVIYEHWFVGGAAGAGIATIMNCTFLDTANSSPIGEFVMSSPTLGIFTGLVGDETSALAATGHNSIAFGGFIGGGTISDNRYFAKHKKLFSGVTTTRWVPYATQSVTNTASSYSVPSDFDFVFNNYTAGVGTVAPPSASGLQKDREITVKNLSTTAALITGLATGEDGNIPAKGAKTIWCNGSAWYVSSGSGSGGGDVTSIETSASDNQLVLFGTATTGKSIKKSTGTGYVKLSSGIASYITAIPVADISATGTPSSSTALFGDGTWKNIGTGGSYIFSSGLAESGGVVTNNLTTGIAGDQIATGSVSAGGDLVLRSTIHSTKGQVVVQDTLQVRANTTAANTAPLKWSKPSAILPNIMTIQEDGAWEWDGTDWWATNLLNGRQKIITAATNAIVTNLVWNAAPITYNYGGRDTWEDGTPTFSVSTGAGTGGSVSAIGGSINGQGQISITTGTSPSSSAIVVSCAFGGGGTSGKTPIVVISPANSTAASASLLVWAVENGTGGFYIRVGTTPLNSGQTYTFNYHVRRTLTAT